MKATKIFTAFFNSEKSGGIILICCTLLSLVFANSNFGVAYDGFWQTQFAGHSIAHWINDGLMAVFFLLIGIELEREIYDGELANFKDALLPIFAAVGGMLLPAAIFLIFNFGGPTQSGAGIPMATDIAFALGVLSLLGKRVPVSLKVFLTALAVIDDLGAILIIAIFYTQTFSWLYFLLAFGVYGILLLLNRLNVRSLIPYLIGGVVMWYFMLHSGVHATITGVLLAFAIPFRKIKGRPSPSNTLEHFLHKPVAFVILPLFALANTAIILSGDTFGALTESYSLGVAAGLIIGKPLGILLLTYLATKLGLCKLPSGLNWKHIFNVGILAGIGFTMSIFITLLAYSDPVVIANTKLCVLLSSLVAGTLGFFGLKFTLKKEKSAA